MSDSDTPEGGYPFHELLDDFVRPEGPREPAPEPPIPEVPEWARCADPPAPSPKPSDNRASEPSDDVAADDPPRPLNPIGDATGDGAEEPRRRTRRRRRRKPGDANGPEAATVDGPGPNANGPKPERPTPKRPAPKRPEGGEAPESRDSETAPGGGRRRRRRKYPPRDGDG